MSELNFQVARVHKLSKSGRVKAFIDLKVADVLVLKGLRVVEGPKGLFVSMPQQQGKDKKWYDTIRCLSKEVRWEISKEVLAAYEE